MNLADWQMVATIGCVLMAALVVARRSVGVFRIPVNAGCGAGCSSCPSQSESTSSKSAGFVSLDAVIDSTENARR